MLNTSQNWFTAPEHIKDNYINKCNLFVENDEAFKNFKRDLDYQKILEGNDVGMATASMKSIELYKGTDFLYDNLEKFKENDMIGNPQMIDGFPLSPSTLRYVSVLINIRKLLEDFKPKRIIEIGGGYGGLCKTISCVYDFDKYTIIDLPIVELLCKKYLSNFKELDGKIDFSVEGEYDLFIADASLAECDIETQMEYAKIAQKCKYVYILYNTLHIPHIFQNFWNFIMSFQGYEVSSYGVLDEKGIHLDAVQILTFKKIQKYDNRHNII